MEWPRTGIRSRWTLFIKLSYPCRIFALIIVLQKLLFLFSWLHYASSLMGGIIISLLLTGFFISSLSYNYSFPSSFLSPFLSLKLKQLRHLRYSVLHLLHLLLFSTYSFSTPFVWSEDSDYTEGSGWHSLICSSLFANSRSAPLYGCSSEINILPGVVSSSCSEVWTKLIVFNIWTKLHGVSWLYQGQNWPLTSI